MGSGTHTLLQGVLDLARLKGPEPTLHSHLQVTEPNDRPLRMQATCLQLGHWRSLEATVCKLQD